MSDSVSLTSGIAGRYATALFELAKEEDALGGIEADLNAVSDMLSQSDALRDMIGSPLHSREDQKSAILSIADKAGLSSTIRNTLGLLADNHRLFVLPDLVDQTLALIAADRNEITAEVVSAQPLSDDQLKALKDAINVDGADIKLNTSVDESLIGGLIVKVGSRMIDTSIRSKLANLQNAMKEVG